MRSETKSPFLTGVFGSTLLVLARPAVLWGAGLAALAVLQMAFFPLIREIPGLAAWLPARAAGLQRALGVTDPVVTPVGFLNAAGLFLVFPLGLSLFGILFGAPLLARDGSAGGLDILLYRPVSRRRVYLEKFAALGLLLVGMCALLWLILAWRAAALGLPLSLLNLASAFASLFLASLNFAGPALALGALTGRTAVARVLGLSALGLAYLLFLAPNLDPPLRSLGLFSPFTYALRANPLAAGLHLSGLLVLVLAGGLLVLVGILVFERRDQ